MCMARMSSNEESLKGYFGDSPQLTNWILDSGVTFLMTPDISDVIPVSLVETDKYIKVIDGNFVTEKKQENLR